MSTYKRPVCRGSWQFGNNCKTCERCIETRPDKAPMTTTPSEEAIRAACAEAGIPLTAYGPRSIVRDVLDALARRIEAEQAKVPVAHEDAEISYTHKGDTSVRFIQYAKTPIPKWAVDVQPHPPTDREKLENTPTLLLCQQRERIAELEAALRALVSQCWSVEKELTEVHHGIHYSGESEPLTIARQALKGTGNVDA